MHTEPSKHPKNPEIQYEKTDATVRPLYQFLFWISVVTILTALLSWGILRALGSWREGASTRATMAEPQASLADLNAPTAQQPPGPRLQLREPMDLARFRAEEKEILSSYGVVDRDNGIYRIPIEEAMRLTLERGLPTPGAAPAVAASPAPKPAKAARP